MKIFILLQFFSFSDGAEMTKILELDWYSDDSTLFIILDTKVMYTLLQLDNSTYYSFNSWFIVLNNNETENISSESLLRNILSPYQTLRLDSRLYFLIVEGTSSENYQANLFEAYRIGELIVNRIASYQNGNYYSANNVNSFIWDRRKDLHGLELQIAVVESKPFTYLLNNVS